MNHYAADKQRVPQWLPWACLGLLVLPFHTLWTDFEQVRRGLLLVLTGTALITFPRLPHVRGERFAWIFLSGLVVSTVLQPVAQSFPSEDTPWSFQAWEAAYRIGHWIALLVMVRIGAMLDLAAIAIPLASLTLATSTFGLLQRFGIAEIGGYGVEREPVSTLGNLNVASEWTAVAGIAVTVLATKVPKHLRWLPITALVMSCAYLIVNPSRSGKVAMLAGLIVLGIMRRKQRGYVPIIIATAGCLLGVLLAATVPKPQLGPQAVQKELERGTVTLDIRLEIVKSTAQLVLESPLFGKGPGQFAVEYPRHRSQQEIEASSFGRQFPTEVRTVHNDWLELLVDGGVIALLLFVAMLFALQRGTKDKTRLIPMFVLCLLMLVRAPIGNAPAAAVAFLLLGSTAQLTSNGTTPKRQSKLLWALLGLVMIVLGTLPTVGNTVFTPYMRAMRDAKAAPITAASDANWWMPYEPRWLQVEARACLGSGDLKRAAHLAAQALELRPFSPPLLLLLAEVLAQGNRYGEAIAVADKGLTLDPANPELRVLKSAALAALGDVDRAIAAVVIDPHPLLRDKLEDHFLDLAMLADKRNETKQAKRYLIEHAFIALANRLGNQDPEVALEIRTLNQRMADYVKQTDQTAEDLRFFVTSALEALDLGKKGLAETYGAAAAKGSARLTSWQAAILGSQIERLRPIKGWAKLLPPN